MDFHSVKFVLYSYLLEAGEFYLSLLDRMGSLSLKTRLREDSCFMVHLTRGGMSDGMDGKVWIIG